MSGLSVTTWRTIQPLVEGNPNEPVRINGEHFPRLEAIVRDQGGTWAIAEDEAGTVRRVPLYMATHVAQQETVTEFSRSRAIAVLAACADSNENFAPIALALAALGVTEAERTEAGLP